MSRPRRAAAVVLAALALAAAGPWACGRSPAAARSGVVYLVRHGETRGEGAGRHLSGAGRARAAALADALGDAGVGKIFSTDLPRTLETAEPLARRLGIPVATYDPGRLPELARKLRAAGGTVLVVGHSDTTPELVGLLGGEPGAPIVHDEHDRLYRVELPSGRTTLSRFGD